LRHTYEYPHEAGLATAPSEFHGAIAPEELDDAERDAMQRWGQIVFRRGDRFALSVDFASNDADSMIRRCRASLANEAEREAFNEALDQTRRMARRQQREACERARRSVMGPVAAPSSHHRGRAARPACNQRTRGSRRSTASRAGPSDDPDEAGEHLARPVGRIPAGVAS